jgi:hypothetical protein
MLNPPLRRRMPDHRGPDRRRAGASDFDDQDRDTPFPHTQTTGLTHRLFRALPASLVLVWVGAVCLGLVLQARDDGAGPVPRPAPSLLDAAFKAFGALFVPIAWSMRMTLMRIIGSRSPVPTPSAPATASASPTSPAARLAPSSLALLYSSHAALRSAFYRLHVHMMNTKVIAGHVMSDHVLLSSCVLAGLVCELSVVLTDAGRHRGGRRAVLYAFGILLAFVVTGVALEAFVTARHFHGWADTLTSLGLGMGAFKYTAWKRVLHHT